jgi:hypothetical protein
MTRYVARINTATLYTMVVRIDRDGEEQVDSCFRPRHFASLKAAERSAARYIASLA